MAVVSTNAGQLQLQEILFGAAGDLFVQVATSDLSSVDDFGTEIVPPALLIPTKAEGITTTGFAYVWSGSNIPVQFTPGLAGTVTVQTITYTSPSAQALISGPFSYT